MPLSIPHTEFLHDRDMVNIFDPLECELGTQSQSHPDGRAPISLFVSGPSQLVVVCC